MPQSAWYTVHQRIRSDFKVRFFDRFVTASIRIAPLDRVWAAARVAVALAAVAVVWSVPVEVLAGDECRDCVCSLLADALPVLDDEAGLSAGAPCCPADAAGPDTSKGPFMRAPVPRIDRGAPLQPHTPRSPPRIPHLRHSPPLV